MAGPPKSAFGTDMTMVALKTGDRLRTLQRSRDRLAEQIDVCEGSRDLALLVARLQSVMAEIDELAPVSESSAVDEVLKRREDRRRHDQAVGVSHAESRGIGRGHG